MSLASLIPWLIKFSIILTVFAIGLRASFSDATYLFRRPVLLLRALLSMNVIMPLLALIVGVSLELNEPLRIALAALSVSPIPPVMPKKALKSGAEENYTIGLLVATALLSIILIPLTMNIFEMASGFTMQMRFRDITLIVLTSVLLPLIAGMSVRVLWPVFAERGTKPLALVGFVLLILSCLPILFTSVRSILTIVGDGTLFGLAAFAITGLIVGHVLGGPDPDDRPVLRWLLLRDIPPWPSPSLTQTSLVKDWRQRSSFFTSSSAPSWLLLICIGTNEPIRLSPLAKNTFRLEAALLKSHLGALHSGFAARCEIPS